MNPTSLITIPIRLGLAAARRTVEIASSAGRLIGLGGGDAKAERKARPATEPARPARASRASARTRSGSAAARKPARAKGASGSRATGSRATKAKRAPARTRRGTTGARRTAATKEAAPTGAAAKEAAPTAPERVTGIERRFTPNEPVDAEPSPVDLAARREGREPAPLGAREPGGESPDRSTDS